jgi:predicted ATPase
MRIDIHTHTKKVKAGDPATRNIAADKFSDIIKNTDVKILAITNHNHFDLQQYQDFKVEVADSCQIWPGIELDIMEGGKRSHLLVLANPKNTHTFNEKVVAILGTSSPESFTISIKDTVETFDSLDCIYIAHYGVKKPGLDDDEIQLLSSLARNPKRILKEATNPISTGIYISHGHNSIYGSDVHDWDDYISIAKDLPELRLDVESFEQFGLLLDKDEATINTLLNKKVKETIELHPFGPAELIKIDIYDDINILFGSKGTGKSIILDGLSRYYNGKGHKTTVYKSNDEHLNDVFDIKGTSTTVDVTELGIEECTDDIKLLKEATEGEVTSISKYRHHFLHQETNKISQKLKIKNIGSVDENNPTRQLNDVKSVLDEFNSFKEYTNKNETLKEYIEVQLIEELEDVLQRITSQLSTVTEDKFFETHSIVFLNSIVSVFITEISKKTGQPPKPTKTGFAAYASNRIKIECAVKKILKNMDIEIAPMREHVGSLGIKGELYCQTNLVIQNGNFVNGKYVTVNYGMRKNPQKDFAKKVTSISKHIYSNDLFEKISELNQIDGIETVNEISSLLQYHKHFVLNNNEYEPSNGESSMILLYKELTEDKDIYLIDEPEKSLGNDYISEVIVPLLKEKALMGKKVIIATHDANIAVRTLPYSSIYRLHDENAYFTMTGNPFINTLRCTKGSRPELDWKEISMKTLEGGRQAFGERGKIYGN